VPREQVTVRTVSHPYDPTARTLPESGNTFQYQYAPRPMDLDWHEYSNLVSHAVGMVSTQAECSTEEALKLLLQHARSLTKTVEDVASSIVERSIRIAPVGIPGT
jgi:hypothetical protein